MQSWLFVLLSSVFFVVVAADFKLLILHTNDMHARFEQTSRISSKCGAKDVKENNCYGGFARVAQKVKEAREDFKTGKGPPVLFLNGGDNYQGSIWYNVHKWRIAAALTSLLDFDAMALGNHEFDDGVDGLVPFINNVSFPVIAANLNVSQEPLLAATHLQPSVILTVANKKVGVIGYLTPETKEIANAGQVVFNDEVASVKEEASRLKAAGVDILIALGHSGYAVDIKIAEEVPDIDLVVGGHTNTFLYTGQAPDPIDVVQGPYPTVVRQPSGREVPVVQAYAYTKYIGRLELTFDDRGEVTHRAGNPILLDRTVPQDPIVLNDLEVWRKDIEKTMTSKVGNSKVFLRGEAKTCRMYECNLGNFLSDAMVNYYVATTIQSESGWSEAPIAMMNSGGLRGDIDVASNQGEITMGDIMTTLPFENSLMFVRIKGQHLLEALEWSVARYDPKGFDAPGAFLQVSGFHIKYDMCKPQNSRVVSAMVRCGECREPDYKPIDPEKVYGVIMPTYIAQGGDGYKMKQHLVEQKILDITDTGVMAEYIKKMTPIYPGVEGRITFSNAPCFKSNQTVVKSTRPKNVHLSGNNIGGPRAVNSSERNMGGSLSDLIGGLLRLDLS